MLPPDFLLDSGFETVCTPSPHNESRSLSNIYTQVADFIYSFFDIHPCRQLVYHSNNWLICVFQKEENVVISSFL